MTTKDRMELYMKAPSCDAAICANCKHFYMHYIKAGIYIPSGEGHCAHPRLKHRNAYDTCEHFRSNAESPREKVVFDLGWEGIIRR